MPGFVGCAVQEPIAGVQDNWVTLLSFDSPEHLDASLDSDRRAGLVRKAEGVVDADEVRRNLSATAWQSGFGRSRESTPYTHPIILKLNRLRAKVDAAQGSALNGRFRKSVRLSFQMSLPDPVIDSLDPAEGWRCTTSHPTAAATATSPRAMNGKVS